MPADLTPPPKWQDLPDDARETPTKLSVNLQRLIKENGLTISELSRRTRLSQPVLHRIYTGVTDNPSVLTLSPLAKYFGVSISQLIGDIPLVLEKEIFFVPLIEWEDVYNWIKDETLVKKIEYVTTDKVIGKGVFSLLIKYGDLNWQFPTGTILIFDPSLSPKNMDFSLIYEKNALPHLKQVLIEGKEIYLKPLNSSLKTLKMNNEQHFIGVLIQAKKDFL